PLVVALVEGAGDAVEVLEHRLTPSFSGMGGEDGMKVELFDQRRERVVRDAAFGEAPHRGTERMVRVRVVSRRSDAVVQLLDVGQVEERARGPGDGGRGFGVERLDEGTERVAIAVVA